MRPNGLNIVHLWPIALAVALALQLGCTTIGQYKVAPETDLEQANSPTPVVIIVLDGLNQNTLSDYLGQLESNAFSPPWLSGLALLARDQFKLGYTSRGGTVIPSSRHASVAALATGTYPDKNGIVGDGFLVRKATGASRRLELNRPTHGLSVWRTDAGLRPTSTKPSEPSRTTPGKNLARPNWQQPTAPRHSIFRTDMAHTGRSQAMNVAVPSPFSIMQPQRKQSLFSTKPSGSRSNAHSFEALQLSSVTFAASRLRAASAIM